MKKKKIIAQVGIVTSFFLHFITKANQDKKQKKISHKQAKQLMNHQDCVILDIRTKKEYHQGRLQDAILMYENDIVRKADQLLKKNDVIIVYSSDAKISARVVKTLLALGYYHVFDMGSIKGWPYGFIDNQPLKKYE